MTDAGPQVDRAEEAESLSLQELRAVLPPEAFEAATYKLWFLVPHGIVIGLGYLMIRDAGAIGKMISIAPVMPTVVRIISTLLIGHSLACIAFLAHELSHHAIVRGRRIQYLFAVLTLGLNFIPATVWRRLHNQAHHGHANTPVDPDRPFVAQERSPARTWYVRLFYPTKTSSKWNVLVFAHFVTYILRHVATVFYPGEDRPDIVTFKPSYQRRERIAIAGELAAIVVLQRLIWLATGTTVTNYVFASLLPAVVTSGVVMTYVFTNHFLNPITHDHDPIAGTTTVIVPRAWNILHFNFSYHTEHHLFPALNSDYYPLISDALARRCPDRYNRLPIGTAWRRLWEQDVFLPFDESGHIDGDH